MIDRKKMHMAFLYGAMAVAPLAVPSVALAQSAGVENGDDEGIVVTARRREEALQDVPLAVTAITAEQLEATGAADITALTRATPNVTFEVSRGTNSTLTAFIRGVGQQDPLWGFEPGVGLYVDDVYIARPQGSLLDIYDVERLEVLRGPQGTLYGRNTIGGAIKYVTRRLGDEPGANARINVGSYGQWDITASGQMPLGDSFAVGAAVALLNRDGYGKNVNTGAEHYNKEVAAARFSAEWTPSDAFFARLSFDITDDSSNAKHGHRELPARSSVLPVLPDVYDTRAGAGDRNSVETQGASLQLEWRLNDNFTLKSISAFREGDTITPIDFDGLPVRDFDVPAIYADENVSQEFQLAYSGDRISGVAGIYYLSGIATGGFDAILSSLGLTIYTKGKVVTESVSGYADFTLDMTDQWSLSLGGRYTSDTKEGTVLRQNYLGLGSPPLGGAALILGAPATNFRRERTDEKFSPRVSVSFEPNDALTLYASYSQGFKSGGFDPRANFSATNVALQPRVLSGFGPETVDSFELGLKGAFFDGRLLLNSALFLADYQDQQVTVQNGADTNGDGINDTFVSSVFNAGQSEHKGLELEGVFSFTDALKANFTLGYIDAEITEVINAGVNVQRDANPLNDFVPQNTPEWTGQFGLSYNADLGGSGNVLFTGAASYRSEFYIFNTKLNQGFTTSAAFPAGGPKLDADAVTLLDLSAVWTSESGVVSFGVHGKNLTDERYRVALYNFAFPAPLGFDSSYSAFYGPPRTVTATLGLKF
jgi:iron complex outermembrane receptor protein